MRRVAWLVCVVGAFAGGLVVPAMTQADGIGGSPYLNGLVTAHADCVGDPLFQRMFNGRGGWLVIPLYQWTPYGQWDTELAGDTLDRLQQAVDAGFCPILRLYWKQTNAENHEDFQAFWGLQDYPPGGWCIPPEEGNPYYKDGVVSHFANWAADVVQTLMVDHEVCGHFIIGNEPNHPNEHGGDGYYPPEWYADVYGSCRQAMLQRDPDAVVIVAGVSPKTRPDLQWGPYLCSLAVNCSQAGATDFAVHSYADLVTGAPRDIDKAYARGQFEQYIGFVEGAIGYANRYYIAETNIHGEQWGEYRETWLIHFFDAVAEWNDNAQSGNYGYRPIRCVCYFSYWLGGEWGVHFDLARNAFQANRNHGLDIAAEKDFPLLIHRNDAPRPRINLLEGGLVDADTNPADAPLGIDGDPGTAWVGGPSGAAYYRLWSGMYDGQSHPCGRLVGFQYQVDPGPMQCDVFLEAGGPSAEHCVPDASDGLLHVWDVELGVPPAAELVRERVYFGIGDDGSDCEVTDTDAGWYEVAAYPPVEAVSEQERIRISDLHAMVNASAGTAVISWKTNVPSTARVDYGPTADYGGQATSDLLQLSHSITLTGLSETTYHYMVTSTATGYVPAASGDHVFTRLGGPAEGLEAYWPLDENWGMRYDMSGHDNHLSCDGVVVAQPGKAGLAADFGRAWGSLWVGDDERLTLTGSVTLVGWIKREGTGSDEMEFLAGKAALGLGESYCIFLGGNKLVMSLNESPHGGGDYACVEGTTELETGVWYHVAGVFDASARTVTLYVNGQVDVSESVSVDYLDDGDTYNFRVGLWEGGEGPPRYPFHGLMDEWRVYSRALGQQEIQQLRDLVVPIIVSNVYVDDITATSAVVHWTTDVPSTSRVDYGETTAYGSSKYSSELVAEHAVSLVGLSPGTLYHYRVTSSADGYADGQSDDATFTTLSVDVGTLRGYVYREVPELPNPPPPVGERWDRQGPAERRDVPAPRLVFVAMEDASPVAVAARTRLAEDPSYVWPCWYDGLMPTTGHVRWWERRADDLLPGLRGGSARSEGRWWFQLTSLPGLGLRPVSGATVTVADRSDTTGSDGRYLIADVPAGVHEVTCSHPELGTLCDTVTINAGQVARKNWVYPPLLPPPP